VQASGINGAINHKRGFSGTASPFRRATGAIKAPGEILRREIFALVKMTERPLVLSQLAVPGSNHSTALS
jgi:hypothetical protein